jgi:hypothetical protein
MSTITYECPKCKEQVAGPVNYCGMLKCVWCHTAFEAPEQLFQPERTESRRVMTTASLNLQLPVVCTRGTDNVTVPNRK